MTDNRCKNCAFFYGGRGEFGHCKIDLPPWILADNDDRFIHRDAKCDLHKPKQGGAENAPTI